MAKFKQGDLVLQSTQRIIQGDEVILDENGSMAVSSLIFSFGSRITEFDSDPTLGELDTRVPTQHAVKTYVDTAISNLNPDKIWEGDSYVEVIDDGTKGTVVAVIDGTTVLDFNNEYNAIQIGKGWDSGLGTIEVADNYLSMMIDNAEYLYIDGNYQVFGELGDTCVLTDSIQKTVVIYTGDSTGNAIAEFSSNGLALNPGGWSGSRINEFSTDGTLVNNSDIAVPTEKAVKTYVDTAISNLNPDKIWEGDSYVEVIDDGTTHGYVTIVTDDVEVANFTDNIQSFGLTGKDTLVIDQTSDTIVVADDQLLVLSIIEDGIKLISGATVSEFSTDGTLADDSDEAVPTEKAVKTYVDNHAAVWG